MKDMVAKGRNVAHPNNKHSAKITPELAKEIKDVYRNSGLSQRAVAEKFGVQQTTVSMIHLGKIWRES
jgi:predicted XRE-type DNA-binding protein